MVKDLVGDVPAALTEFTLGCTVRQRAESCSACSVRPGTSNGSTEAINGRPEHLHGTDLYSRNLAHRITRSLLETGGFRPLLRPQI